MTSRSTIFLRINGSSLVAERPVGAFTGQVFPGDTLDAYPIEADYTAGVLTVACHARA